jgi:putative ABC transport system ATP-binding protein
MSAGQLIGLEAVEFRYPGPSGVAFRFADFSLGAGEQIFLKGPSGSGKSTLLGLIAGVMTPRRGKVTVLGEVMSSLGAASRDRLRARAIGVVFQQFNLIPYLTVADNIALPLHVSAARLKAVNASGGARSQILHLMEALGLEAGLAGKPARSLSVGQQQRVGVARALIGAPSLILADEPTSALDSDARDRFMALLRDQVRATGAGLIFVSHDQSLSTGFDRNVTMAELTQEAL